MLYRCKNCGSNVVYDPKSKKMKCPHCEGLDTEDAIAGESLENCPNCGAPVKPTEYQSAHRCAHCGVYLIVDERIAGDYKPHLIIPFKLDKNDAAQRLRTSFNHRLFMPDSFLSEATLEKMEGMYVPFFLFDIHSHYLWTGRGTRIRKWVSGDTEYTETKIFRVERDMVADFEHVPADASVVMDDDIMDLMEPYDYKLLEDFQQKYMSGFYGEMYSQTAVELTDRAKAKIRPGVEQMMQSSLGSYTTLTPDQRNMELEEQQHEYALLPVWVYTYNYHGKTYNYFVNGQSGKVIGKSPFAMSKVVGYCATWFGFIMLAGQLIRMIMEVL
ncbi:MAG: zinc ribbon domain-containing protein [Lachnospiraceae bacterium]|nr:zinc ribbon domain-containing protein [Lachnospiraceae bacterium]